MRNRLVLVATIAYTFLAISCSKKSDEILALLQEIKQQNSDLKAQVTSLQKTTDSLSAALKITNQNIAGMDRKIDSIRSQLNSMVSQINTLSAQLNQANVNIADLQKRIAELQAKCQELVDLLRLLTGSINLSNGLIAYYPFTGNAGDSSGNGNHGTINFASLSTDRFGKANSSFTYDGAQSYFQAPLSFTSYTISLWYNTPLLKNPFNCLYLYNNTYAELTSNSIVYARYQYPQSPSLSGITNYQTTLNQWHNLIVSFNATAKTLEIYINGKNQFSAIQVNDGSFNSLSENNILYLGAAFWNKTNFFNGKIDDVRVYNRALTQQEITYLANN